jgi:hypothetical protein
MMLKNEKKEEKVEVDEYVFGISIIDEESQEFF